MSNINTTTRNVSINGPIKEFSMSLSIFFMLGDKAKTLSLGQIPGQR
jgi:hypothetical protein